MEQQNQTAMTFSATLHKLTCSYLGQILLVGVAYYITAQLGLSLALQPEKASPFFPAAGVALAALLIGGYRLWIGVVLGGLFLNIPNFIHWLHAEGSSMPTIIIGTAITVGSTLQALVGAWLVRRARAYPGPLETIKAIISIVVLGGPVSCLIAATCAITAISNIAGIPWHITLFKWFSWWVGDSIGVILTTPILLLTIAPAKTVLLQRKRAVVLGFVILSLLLIGLVQYLDVVRKRDVEISFTTQSTAAFAVLKARATGTEELLHALNAHDAIFGDEEFAKNIALRIEDVNTTADHRLLYGEDIPKDALLQWSDTLETGEHHWRVTFYPTPNYLSDQMLKAFRELLVMAILLSTLGSILLLVVTGRSDVVYRLVDERTEALRKSEAALHDALADLKVTNEDLEKFAYVASHDLKSPLRAIDNLAKWLEEDLADKLESKNKDRLEKMRGRVNRMEQLLDDLLEYARAGRTFENKETLQTDRLIEDITHLLNIPQGFTVNIDESLKAIVIPRMPLEQIFHNLISNAIKHHDKKKGTVTVTGTTRSTFYEFAVTDDGPGIPKQFHGKVFEMFQTLKTRDEVEGSGMGLALVQKIIYRFGGKVWLDSDIGKGTTIFFTWPKNPTIKSMTPTEGIAL